MSSQAYAISGALFTKQNNPASTKSGTEFEGDC